MVCIFPSQFLYDLTHNDGTSPVTAVVESWIESIGKNLGIGLRYTKRLYDLLVNRANHLKRKRREVTGGAPRRRFFQKEWELAQTPTRGNSD